MKSKYLEAWARDEKVIETFKDIPQEVVDEINDCEYDVDWAYYFSEKFEIEKMRSFKLLTKKSHGDYGEKTVISPENDFKSKTVMGETASTYLVRGVVDENSLYPIVVIERAAIHIPEEETTK